MLGTQMFFELCSTKEEKGRKMCQQKSVRVCSRSEESYLKKEINQRRQPGKKDLYPSYQERKEAGKYEKMGRLFV